MKNYPLIVIPECDYLEALFLEELKDYTAEGGHLLVMGTETAKLFESELEIQSMEELKEGPAFIAAGKKQVPSGRPYIWSNCNRTRIRCLFFTAAVISDTKKKESLQP